LSPTPSSPPPIQTPIQKTCAVITDDDFHFKYYVCWYWNEIFESRSFTNEPEAKHCFKSLPATSNRILVHDYNLLESWFTDRDGERQLTDYFTVLLNKPAISTDPLYQFLINVIYPFSSLQPLRSYTINDIQCPFISVVKGVHISGKKQFNINVLI
jgi:hypothetical protein